MVIVVGASNTWFAQTLSALAVPQVGASALQAKVEQLWEHLQNVTNRADARLRWGLPQFQALHQWGKDDVFDAIAQHRKAAEAGAGDQRRSTPTCSRPSGRSSPPRCRPSRPTTSPSAATGGVPAAAGRVPLRRRAGRTAARSARAGRVHPAGRARPAKTPTW